MPGLTTRVIAGIPEHLEVEAAELRVTKGPARGRRLDLGTRSMVLGSDPGCDLFLDDATVSRRHAEVTPTHRGYRIRDLGSKNGIVVDRVPIERAYLVDRMKFRLGDSEVQVKSIGHTTRIKLNDAGTFAGLIAHSLAMRALVADLEALAQADTTLLIEGETGVGKEVVARALHHAGPRCRGPFVVLDCGAQPGNLFASALFGHVRGAFSGADQDQMGLLEAASGGTLLVDEVGELALETQPLLLRAMEGAEVRKVGGAPLPSLDVRILAATNRNLTEESRAGRFREDLYYRLAVARVRVPPLRERPEDMPLLAQEFARPRGVELPEDLLVAMREHPWPGNVRELRNAIERMRVMHNPKQLLDGQQQGHQDPYRSAELLRPLADARRLAAGQFEQRYVREALADSDGNVSRAAKLAGISRQSMTALVARHRQRVRDRKKPT